MNSRNGAVLVTSAKLHKLHFIQLFWPTCVAASRRTKLAFICGCMTMLQGLTATMQSMCSDATTSMDLPPSAVGPLTVPTLATCCTMRNRSGQAEGHHSQAQSACILASTMSTACSLHAMSMPSCAATCVYIEQWCCNAVPVAHSQVKELQAVARIGCLPGQVAESPQGLAALKAATDRQARLG